LKKRKIDKSIRVNEAVEMIDTLGYPQFIKECVDSSKTFNPGKLNVFRNGKRGWMFVFVSEVDRYIDHLKGSAT
jgi:hypothetical protein